MAQHFKRCDKALIISIAASAAKKISILLGYQHQMLCHPEQSEGPMYFAGVTNAASKCIGPSRQRTPLKMTNAINRVPHIRIFGLGVRKLGETRGTDNPQRVC